jgi:acyl-CoA thioester hydrolase
MRHENHLIIKHPHELLRDYPVVVALSVEWGDQDILAHVNNTVFLKWCETSRVVYLEKSGLWRFVKEEGRGPIIAALSCNYRRPVTFPDTIHVGSRVTRIGRSSFRMEHALVSLAQDAVVAEVDSTMVFVEYSSGKTHAVPPDVREAMERLEGRTLSS